MTIVEWLDKLIGERFLHAERDDDPQDRALADIRDHIDTLGDKSTAMERRLAAIEREQQRKRGWIGR